MTYNIKLVDFVKMLILFFVCISCKKNLNDSKTIENTKNTLSYWRERNIILPNDSLIKNHSLEFPNPKNRKIKIITLINGSCGSCIYELNEWEKFRKKINSSQLGLIYLVYSNDNLHLFKDLLSNSKINFNHPYFEDIDKRVIGANGFSKYDTNFQTFLIDKYDNIILAGNPISNKKIKELYLKEIQKRLK